MSFTIPIESAYAVPPQNEGNSAVTECATVANNGDCDLTTFSFPTTGSSRLLVVIATLDGSSTGTPEIDSIEAGNLDTSTDTLILNTAITSGGTDDHVVAVYYLHEKNWSNFIPGSGTDEGIRVNVGVTPAPPDRSP